MCIISSRNTSREVELTHQLVEMSRDKINAVGAFARSFVFPRYRSRALAYGRCCGRSHYGSIPLNLLAIGPVNGAKR